MSNQPLIVNPYQPPQPVADSSGFTEAAPRRPRIWTVFVVFIVACVATIVGQIVAAIAVVGWYASQGVNLPEIPQVISDAIYEPPMFMTFAAGGQLALGICAIVPAWISREPFRQRLGLVKSKLSLPKYLVVLIGSILPFAVGLFFAHLLTYVLVPDDTAARLYERMTPGWAVIFILFIAFAPGFFEEMLFRGYMQRRLLEHWSPWLAISVTSVLFGAMHLMPHVVVFAFVVGLWLGVLAWKTGSTWPGIACHAFLNGAWNVLHIGRRFDYLPESTPMYVWIIGGMIVLVCFSLSVRWIYQTDGNENMTRGEHVGV